MSVTYSLELHLVTPNFQFAVTDVGSFCGQFNQAGIDFNYILDSSSLFIMIAYYSLNKPLLHKGLQRC